MKENRKAIDGWRIKGALEWGVAMGSFMAFLALEACLLYAYYIFLLRA